MGNKTYMIYGMVLLGLILVAIAGGIYAGDLLTEGTTSSTYTKVIDAKMNPYIETDFNSKYGAITLENSKTGKVVEYNLIETTDSIIDISMRGKAVLYVDGTLFDDALFKDKYGGMTNIQSGSYSILVTKDNYIDVVDTSKEVCLEALNKTTGKTGLVCSIVNTYKNINVPISSWQVYKGEVLKAGNYEWRFDGKKYVNQIADVVPVKENIELKEWVWFNTTFGSKKIINISERTGNDWVNYSVYMNISYAPQMNVDFSDIRFVDANESLELPYWVESKVNSQSAMVWVKTNLTKNTNTSIYMYFENPTATTTSNKTNAFLFWDDGTTDKTSWYGTSGGLTTWLYTGGYYNLKGDGGHLISMAYPAVLNNSYGNISITMTGINEATVTYTAGIAIRGSAAGSFNDVYKLQKLNSNLDARVADASQGTAGTTTNGLDFNATIWAFGSQINYTGQGTISTGSIQIISSTYKSGFIGAWNYNDGTTKWKTMLIRQFANFSTEPTTTVGPIVQNNPIIRLNITGVVVNSNGVRIPNATIVIIDNNGQAAGLATSNATGEWTWEFTNGTVTNYTIVGYNTYNMSQGGAAYPFFNA
jgi:hypothetical protein